MNSEKQAGLIKLAAVAASATRWIGALAASEGLYVPAEWLPWWRILSFLMAAAMAAVEALAFSYALRAWRYMKPESPQAQRMMALIVLAVVTFVAVMAPSIVAYVQHQEINQVLSGLGLWLWGVAVTLSTVVVLGMVGYAQGRMSASDVTRQERQPEERRDTDATPTRHRRDMTRHDATPLTRDEFVSLLRDNGSESVASLARQYGINPRRAQRWAQSGNGRKEDPSPVETEQGGEL